LNGFFFDIEPRADAHENDAIKKQYRFDLSEIPEYIGRAVVALAAAENTIEKTANYSGCAIVPANMDLPIATAATSQVSIRKLRRSQCYVRRLAQKC
jgi:hypothetical protein